MTTGARVCRQRFWRYFGLPMPGTANHPEKGWACYTLSLRLSMINGGTMPFNTFHQWNVWVPSPLMPCWGSLALSKKWDQGWVTEVISPVLSKVMKIELSPWLFSAMHQNTFVDLEKWVNERAWVVLRLPSGSMGHEGAKFNCWCRLQRFRCCLSQRYDNWPNSILFRDRRGSRDRRRNAVGVHVVRRRQVSARACSCLHSPYQCLKPKVLSQWFRRYWPTHPHRRFSLPPGRCSSDEGYAVINSPPWHHHP